jgi:hypothetical protein
MSRRPSQEDWLPDVRDGLSRVERIVLHTLAELQDELAASGRWPRDPATLNVKTPMLYGRVVEKIDISVAELQAVLGRLAGRGGPP